MLATGGVWRTTNTGEKERKRGEKGGVGDALEVKKKKKKKTDELLVGGKEKIVGRGEFQPFQGKKLGGRATHLRSK